MKITFAIIAALLAVIGNVPYLRDIIKKKSTATSIHMARLVHGLMYHFFWTTGKRCGYWSITDGRSGDTHDYYFLFFIKIRF